MALVRLETGEAVWYVRSAVVIADKDNPPLWLRLLLYLKP